MLGDDVADALDDAIRSKLGASDEAASNSPIIDTQFYEQTHFNHRIRTIWCRGPNYVGRLVRETHGVLNPQERLILASLIDGYAEACQTPQGLMSRLYFCLQAAYAAACSVWGCK